MPDHPLWLTVNGVPAAPLEVAATRRARRRGLLGREGIEGALLLRPAGSVHTFGMRFSIDVAFCDHDLRVRRILTLSRGRMTRPDLRARAVIEAEAGRFATWGIHAGAHLGLAGTNRGYDGML